MFERFTQPARSVVERAQQEARDLRHDHIGTEHLLLGLLQGSSDTGSRALARLGVELEGVRSDVARLGRPGSSPPQDEALLETLGIDMDEVRRRVEDAFGPGALDRAGRRSDGCGGSVGRVPFSPEAKKAIELSLREAVRLHDPHIGTEHLLLGLVRGGDSVAAGVLERRGAPQRAVQEAVEAELKTEQDNPEA